jgi:DNA-binding CsgD family transcriptional regulator
VVLFGRAQECQVVDEMLAAAREGLSRTLVIQGEAGIGKTTLLDYAATAADDFLVVHFTGIESEQTLAFAALHRLLTPVLHQIARLPAPQRDALNSALGLAAGPPADRYLVGLGVISLAANAARARRRLLCIIDDAQWVDRESIETLAFWGRRIHAEGIALIFSERVGTTSPNPLDGFPTLEVRGLTSDAARQLVAAHAELPLDTETADGIVAQLEGNPLAILELSQRLRADQLNEAVLAPRPLALGRRLEEHFMGHVRSLPIEAQMMLLLVAADSTGDAAVVWKAASVLGVNPEAAETAEGAGLLILDAPIRLRHPLIRSAVYGSARPADRRAVHRALGVVADETGDRDRRAWHLAAATIGGDEHVAGLLEERASYAGDRGGHTTRAALLSRAAEMTPDPRRAAARFVDAAEAALAGGSPHHAQALLKRAMPALDDPTVRARAERLEGSAWKMVGQTGFAAPVLLSAAQELLTSEPELGRYTLLEAFEAALLSGHFSNESAEIVNTAAAAAKSSKPSVANTVDLLLDALTTYVTSGYLPSVPKLRSALTSMTSVDGTAEELIRWAVLASSVSRALWDQDAHDEVMSRLARVRRQRGALPFLGAVLEAQATSEVWAGHFSSAELLFSQAGEVFSEAGFGALAGNLMGLDLLVYRGQEAEARATADMVLAVAKQLGMGALENVVDRSLTVLDLATGHYREAMEHSVAVFNRDPLPLGTEVLPDLIEAAVRIGDLEVAKAAMDRLADRAPASGTAWAAGLLARGRALLAGDDGETHYREAIGHFASTRLVVELARSHLVYGEWLRRQSRRVDAREELRTAYDAFETMGVTAFAQRARTELLATGEHARKRTVESSDNLTPQETHVAQLAAAGETNTEIATQLYISTSTVEYHLRKVYRKLAITSRRQLKRALPPS